jgi:hypothetical protein
MSMATLRKVNNGELLHERLSNERPAAGHGHRVPEVPDRCACDQRLVRAAKP